MRRFFKPVASAMLLGLTAFTLAACGVGGPAPAERLKATMQDAAMSAPGIASAQVHVNMNTSGNFITAKLVGTGSDQATLAQALDGALPAMLEETEDLETGTLSISIFSADDAVSVGASALGYSGGTSLSDFREYFLDRS
jgi:predicted small lipoprotein YifL